MDSTGYEDFDIDRSTAQGWAEFADRLGDVISVIDDSADLVIGTESDGADDGGPFVSFTAPQPETIRAEAAGNNILSEPHQLGADDRKQLTDAGWHPPDASGGGGNFWAELPQDQSDELAGLAVTALRDVYGVPHPVFLAPDPLAEILTPKVDDADDEDDRHHHAHGRFLEPGPLSDENPVTVAMPRDRDELDALVDTELTDLFGHRPVRDAAGDMAVRAGSTMVFLRTAADASQIVIFAAVVCEITASRSRAVEVLNELNCDAGWTKFQLIQDRIFVSLTVLARPFVGIHLRQAMQTMSDVADGIDEDLAAKLGGRTTFDQSGPGP